MVVSAPSNTHISPTVIVAVAIAVCGDLACDDTETCSTCDADCGACTDGVTVTMIDPQDGGYMGTSAALAARTTNTTAITSLSFYRDGDVYLGDGTPWGDDRFSLAIDPRPLSEGPHSFYAVALTASGAVESDPVTVTVDHASPSVALTTPVADSSVANGVLVQVAASDTASGIREVIFYRTSNGAEIESGRVTSPPFVFRTTLVTPGPHAFRARAFDGTGNSADTSEVSVTASGTDAWVERFASENTNGMVTPRDVAVGSDGQTVLVGSFDHTANLGGAPLSSAGQTDCFVAKLARDGSHVWSVGVGSVGAGDGSSAVALDSNGDIAWTGYLHSPIAWAGGTHVGGFVAKYSALGAPLWVHSYGGEGMARSVAVDDSGNVITAGTFRGSNVFDGQALTSAGGSDVWVTKHSPTGALLWVTRLGGEQDDGASGVDVDSAGNVMLVGQFHGTVSFGTDLRVAQGSDIFVVKLSASAGTALWSTQLGDAMDDTGGDVRIDPSGNIVVSGILDANPLWGGLGFVAKLSPAGAPMFSLSFGENIATVELAVGLDGRIGIAGSWSGQCAIGGIAVGRLGSASQAYAGQLSSTGQLLSLESYGGADTTTATGLAVRPEDGTLLVTGFFGGYTSQPADFGGQSFTRIGTYDAFLYALPADPTISGH